MNANINPYVFEHATLRARLLCVTAGFPSDSIEDTRQDLVLDYLRRSPKFDDARGPWEGFVRGVMQNRATVLVAQRCRRVRHEVFACDLPNPGFDEQRDFFETVAGDDESAGVEASMDVQRVLQHLPGHLQRLAALLQYMPTAEACVASGRSRSWGYQRIREIRGAFVKAGLEPRRNLNARGAKYADRQLQRGSEGDQCTQA